MTDLAAITDRQQKAWSTGDFARVAGTIVFVSERLVEAVDVRPGDKVLDVAAGSGNTAIAAARRWADVLATDYVPGLLESATKRAELEGFPIRTEVADAQNLPYEDGSFDVVLSTFGAMFAPDQEKTASELLRVTRSGGKIGMSNWTPDGLVAAMFRTTGKYAPPPPGVRPPSEWGDEGRLRELFGDGVASLEVIPRVHMFKWLSPQHMVDYFREWFGPTKTAFDQLDAPGQESYARDLADLLEQHNTSGDETLVAPARYIDVLAIRA